MRREANFSILKKKRFLPEFLFVLNLHNPHLTAFIPCLFIIRNFSFQWISCPNFFFSITFSFIFIFNISCVILKLHLYKSLLVARSLIFVSCSRLLLLLLFVVPPPIQVKYHTIPILIQFTAARNSTVLMQLNQSGFLNQVCQHFSLMISLIISCAYLGLLITCQIFKLP